MKFSLVPIHTFGTPHAQAVYWAACDARALLAESNVDIEGLQAKIATVFDSWRRDHGVRTASGRAKTIAKRPASRKSIAAANADANSLDRAFQLAREQYEPFSKLLEAEGWTNIFLAVLVLEVTAHPDVNPSSVIRVLSLLLRLSAAATTHLNDYKQLYEDERVFGKETVRDLRRARGGLKKGSSAGGAVVEQRAQVDRANCINVDKELLRDPIKRKWSLDDRAEFVQQQVTKQRGWAHKPRAMTTIKGYLKSAKRAAAKSTKA